MTPDVWTVIKEKIKIQTQIFSNPQDLDEELCENVIRDAFQVRCTLIMQRYRFFTYERRGNQAYTDFYTKLQELAAAASLENLNMRDYLCLRIIAGLNDSKTVDKILFITAYDLTLEKVNYVAVACESALNHSNLHSLKMYQIRCWIRKILTKNLRVPRKNIRL